MASFILPIISGLAGLFGGGKQQQQSGNFSGNQTSSSTGTTSGTSTSTPNLSPIQQRLLGLFSGGLEKNLADTDLTGYTQGGLQNIAQTGRAARRSIAGNLASRGLSFSPAAANPAIQQGLNESNQQNSFLAGIPLLQRQLRQNALDQVMRGFSSIPTGSTTTSSGTTNTTGTSSSTGNQSGTISGNPWAGLVSGFGAGLAGPGSSGSGSNLDDILRSFGFGKSPSNPNPNVPDVGQYGGG